MHKRLWDKARESRPSIYEKARNPFTKDANPRDMGYDEFSRFFMNFVEEKKPAARPDIHELHRCLALASHSFSDQFHFTPVSLGKSGYPFNLVFPNALAVRGTLCAIAPEESALLALGFVKKQLETRLRAFPVGHASYAIARKTDGCATFVSALLDYSKGKIRLDPDAESRIRASLCGQSGKCSKTGNAGVKKPCERFKASRPSQEIELLGVELDPSIKDCVGSRLVNAHRHTPFEYPFFLVRLLAILGTDKASTYHITESAHFGTLVNSFDNNGSLETISTARTSASSIAAIGMYPWEADHLLKARELSRRGIGSAKPLGRMFAGEVELGLFSWVPGTPLRDAPTPAWKAYGRTLRKCHERGVFLNDAAGRNAIWDGRITLIDYEHTYFTPEPRPLTSEERSVSLSRIAFELTLSDPKKEAFASGYGSRLPY